MPLSFVGSAAPNADPFTVTGIPFPPLALIAWFIDSTTEDSFVASVNNSYGFASNNGGSTQERCVGLQYNDNVATTIESNSWHSALLGYTNNGGTTVKINVSAWTSDGFTVTGANGKRFGYVALGGSDLIAKVVEDDWPTTGATFTVVGTGFIPDCVVFLSGPPTGLGADTRNVSTLGVGFGCASSTSDQWSAAITHGVNGSTMASAMRVDSVFSADSAISLFSADADTIDAKAPIASFDSDGVTMTNSNAPTAARRVFMLALKGGQYKAGSVAAATGSGNQTFTFNTPTFIPKSVVLVQTPGTTSNTVVAASGEISIGASDGTNEGYGAVAIAEAINTQADKYRSVTKSIAEITPGTPTLTRSADVGTFTSGSFVANWSAGGAARLVGFLAIGVKPSLAPDTLKYQRQRLRISRRSSI